MAIRAASGAVKISRGRHRIDAHEIHPICFVTLSGLTKGMEDVMEVLPFILLFSRGILSWMASLVGRQTDWVDVALRTGATQATRTEKEGQKVLSCPSKLTWTLFGLLYLSW